MAENISFAQFLIRSLALVDRQLDQLHSSSAQGEYSVHLFPFLKTDLSQLFDRPAPFLRVLFSYSDKNKGQTFFCPTIGLGFYRGKKLEQINAQELAPLFFTVPFNRQGGWKQEDHWKFLSSLNEAFIPFVTMTSEQIILLLPHSLEDLLQLQILLEQLRDFWQKKSQVQEYPSPIGSVIAQRPNVEQWGDQHQTVLQQIDQGLFHKVVLARELQYSLNSIENDPHLPLLQNLFHTEGPVSHHCFYLSLPFGEEQQECTSFLSLTPETLFSYQEGQIALDALAGTTKKGVDKGEEQRLAADLLLNNKERNEHQLVIEDIQQKVESHFKNKQFKIEIGETKVLTLPRLQHLYTPINVYFNQSVAIGKLIASLHPTAAICGLPAHVSMNFLEQSESFDRGLYAGAVGFSWKNSAQLIVAIRSSLFQRQSEQRPRLYAFAGAGIVATSHANQEWIETDCKFQSFLHQQIQSAEQEVRW